MGPLVNFINCIIVIQKSLGTFIVIYVLFKSVVQCHIGFFCNGQSLSEYKL
jgi:hypothetical protein